jgi:nucleoside-diphosphate-sugar epimerase
VKVLVTGGTGFVGSHAIAALLAAGHDVRVLAREPGKVARVLAPLGTGVTDVAAGDMTDAAAVDRALDGCGAVVHCAAEIGVAGGSQPATAANVDGARLVIGGAAGRGVERVVYTSSVTVHLPAAGPVLTPDSPLAEPLTAYGAQKAEIERYVRELQAGGAPVTTLVVGGVFGPCSPHTGGSFAAILAALAAGMYAPESGLGIVDVRDLAAIICRCAGLGADGGPRRYLVSGRYVTWREWAALLAEASGQPVPYTAASADEMIALGRKFDEMRADGADLPPLSEEAAIIMSSGCPGDDTATLAEFGLDYRPAIETFRDTVAWLRAAGHLSDAPEAGGART